jgi:hypothetical protein
MVVNLVVSPRDFRRETCAPKSFSFFNRFFFFLLSLELLRARAKRIHPITIRSFARVVVADALCFFVPKNMRRRRRREATAAAAEETQNGVGVAQGHHADIYIQLSTGLTYF